MKDRRPVDELSIEELEEYLRLRKRAARLQRVRDQGQPVSGASFDPLAPPSPVVVAPDPRAIRQPQLAGGPRYSTRVETAPRRRGIRWGWVWDRFLLFIEILALIGLLWVVFQMFTTVQDLNEESRVLQLPSTPTVGPVIGVVLLPGGHTPPDQLGRAEPEPIPAHLRAFVAAVTPMPAPTPGPEHAQRIVIPVLSVDAPVVAGDDWESLKKGAGHHIGSANPGERGNAVISAHNDIYGEIFRDLQQLNIGDEVVVHTQSQQYRYVVQQTRIVLPTEVSVMAPTSTPVLTLISCYPYRVNTHRIVVSAALVP